MPGAWIDSAYSPLQVPRSPAIIMPESQPAAPPAGNDVSPQVLNSPPEQPLAEEVSSVLVPPHPPAEPVCEVSLEVDSPHTPPPHTPPPHAPPAERLAEEIPLALGHPSESQLVQGSPMPLDYLPEPQVSQSARESPLPWDALSEPPESQPGDGIHSSSDTEPPSAEEKVRLMAEAVMRLAEEASTNYPALQVVRQAESDKDSIHSDNDEDVEDKVNFIIELIGIFIRY